MRFIDLLFVALHSFEAELDVYEVLLVRNVGPYGTGLLAIRWWECEELSANQIHFFECTDTRKCLILTLIICALNGFSDFGTEARSPPYVSAISMR